MLQVQKQDVRTATGHGRVLPAGQECGPCVCVGGGMQLRDAVWATCVEGGVRLCDSVGHVCGTCGGMSMSLQAAGQMGGNEEFLTFILEIQLWCSKVRNTVRGIMLRHA